MEEFSYSLAQAKLRQVENEFLAGLTTEREYWSKVLTIVVAALDELPISDKE